MKRAAKEQFIRKQVFLLMLLAAVAMGLWCIHELREERVPLLSEVRLAAAGSGIFLSDRNGRALQQASWLPLSEISPEFMEQLVAVEDRRFYMHPGRDLLGSLGALRDRAAVDPFYFPYALEQCKTNQYYKSSLNRPKNVGMTFVFVTRNSHKSHSHKSQYRRTNIDDI